MGQGTHKCLLCTFCSWHVSISQQVRQSMLKIYSVDITSFKLRFSCHDSRSVMINDMYNNYAKHAHVCTHHKLCNMYINVYNCTKKPCVSKRYTMWNSISQYCLPRRTVNNLVSLCTHKVGWTCRVSTWDNYNRQFKYDMISVMIKLYTIISVR